MDSDNSPLPSYNESQMAALLQLEDQDALLAHLLTYAESHAGRELSLEAVKLMKKGIFPVELHSYKEISSDSKKSRQPMKAQTLDTKLSSGKGYHRDSERPMATPDATTTDEESDSEVEKAQKLLLKAQKKKAERQKNKLKARTVDDTVAHSGKLENASPPPSPALPYPYNPGYWPPRNQMPMSPFMTPTTSSPVAHGIPVTYNHTHDCNNDNSVRFVSRGKKKPRHGTL